MRQRAGAQHHRRRPSRELKTCNKALIRPSLHSRKSSLGVRHTVDISFDATLTHALATPPSPKPLPAPDIETTNRESSSASTYIGTCYADDVVVSISDTQSREPSPAVDSSSRTGPRAVAFTDDTASPLAPGGPAAAGPADVIPKGQSTLGSYGGQADDLDQLDWDWMDDAEEDRRAIGFSMPLHSFAKSVPGMSIPTAAPSGGPWFTVVAAPADLIATSASTDWHSIDELEEHDRAVAMPAAKAAAALVPTSTGPVSYPPRYNVPRCAGRFREGPGPSKLGCSAFFDPLCAVHADCGYDPVPGALKQKPRLPSNGYVFLGLTTEVLTVLGTNTVAGDGERRVQKVSQMVENNLRVLLDGWERYVAGLIFGYVGFHSPRCSLR